MDVKKRIKRIYRLVKPTTIETLEYPHYWYSDEIVKLTLGRNRIVPNDNLETYLSAALDQDLDFNKGLVFYALSFEKDFNRQMHKMFYARQETAIMLGLHPGPQDHLLAVVKRVIEELYEYYKEYLIGLSQFYCENPGLAYPLDCYPQSMLSVPFYDHIIKKGKLNTFTQKDKTYCYLQLVERVVFSRFLSLEDDVKQGIINALSIFTNTDHTEIVKIAKRTRDKLYKYRGIKCPDNLIYISILSTDQALLLAQFVQNNYFESGTPLQAIKLAFLGRMGVTPDNNPELEQMYSDSPFFFKPPIIKKNKLGYVAFILAYLHDHRYLIVENLWHSISTHGYFRAMKRDGTIARIAPNQFAKSLTAKKLKLLTSNSKTSDTELEHLVAFLKGNFPKKRY
ncbi:MAG: hypothetical protein AAGF77_04050 [Bacteroidota bacterium]